MNVQNGTINGKKIADRIEERLSGLSITPRLEIILVGDNEASRTFVEEKIEAVERIGFNANLQRFDENVEQEKIVEQIKELNKDDSVNGILVQLPLPDHIDNHEVFSSINTAKDVDGLHPLNLGKTLRGKPELVPAAVRGIEKIVESENFELEGSNAVIVNNSNLIGKPLAMRLTVKGATVTICHEKTKDLERHLEDADLVVTATGVRDIIEAEDVPKGCLVIDGGYAHGEGDIEEVDDIAKKARISPVPDGLGPLTVAMTMDNLVKCYRMQE